MLLCHDALNGIHHPRLSLRFRLIEVGISREDLFRRAKLLFEAVFPTIALVSCISHSCLFESDQLCSICVLSGVYQLTGCRFSVALTLAVAQGTCFVQLVRMLPWRQKGHLPYSDDPVLSWFLFASFHFCTTGTFLLWWRRFSTLCFIGSVALFQATFRSSVPSISMQRSLVFRMFGCRGE